VFELAAKLGTAAIVSGLLLYLIIYHGPKQESRWIAALEKRDVDAKEQRSEFTESLQEQRDHDRKQHENTHEKVGGLTTAIDHLVIKIDNIKCSKG